MSKIVRFRDETTTREDSDTFSNVFSERERAESGVMREMLEKAKQELIRLERKVEQTQLNNEYYRRLLAELQAARTAEQAALQRTQQELEALRGTAGPVQNSVAGPRGISGAFSQRGGQNGDTSAHSAGNGAPLLNSCQTTFQLEQSENQKRELSARVKILEVELEQTRKRLCAAEKELGEVSTARRDEQMQRSEAERRIALLEAQNKTLQDALLALQEDKRQRIAQASAQELQASELRQRIAILRQENDALIKMAADASRRSSAVTQAQQSVQAKGQDFSIEDLSAPQAAPIQPFPVSVQTFNAPGARWPGGESREPSVGETIKIPEYSRRAAASAYAPPASLQASSNINRLLALTQTHDQQSAQLKKMREETAQLLREVQSSHYLTGRSNFK